MKPIISPDRQLQHFTASEAASRGSRFLGAPDLKNAPNVVENKVGKL